MKCTLLLLLIYHACLGVSGLDLSNEGNEFYIGFFRNRFGDLSKHEAIPPILWVTTRESTPVSFNVTTIDRVLFAGFANAGEVTYVNTSLELIVSEATEEQFKGIHIKAEASRRIVVYGQHEELGSNDAFLALPIIPLLEGIMQEYIIVSVNGNDNDIAIRYNISSVALIVGTENGTRVTIIPSLFRSIQHHSRTFNPRLPDLFNTIKIDQFETVYLQSHAFPQDLSGTRIIADKPISVFSGHECAFIPIDVYPCDMLIEQITPIDTWGILVVTIPLRTRSGGDMVKVIAAHDSTTVNITRTNFETGRVTKDASFTLNSGGYREDVISDYTLIQSNRPIGVFQFSRSYQTDSVSNSDPFMMYVPPFEQYRSSYAVATAPFDASLVLPHRPPYVNYTNIAVPAEYFNVSLLTINNNTAIASEFVPIRRADGSIWGYGAQLLLDEGAQLIRHQVREAKLGVTLYGFSNQMSWGSAGGMGIGPIEGSLFLNCAANCLTSNKLIITTWRLPYHLTCEHTYSVIITCDNGYRHNSTKVACSYDLKSGLVDEWTVPPNTMNCTVEVATTFFSIILNNCESCGFLWFYPDICIQSINADLPKVYSVDKYLKFADIETNDAGNNRSINCECRYGSLEEALRNLDNNTFVNVSASYVALPVPVSVTKLNNITISGHNYPTVDCNYTGSFECKDCHNVAIDNINWMKCGFFKDESSSGKVDPTSGLRIHMCKNFIIRLCTFVASLIQILQTSGSIHFENAEFLGYQSSSNSSSLYQDYGGLFVEVDDIAMAEIKILNCSFTDVRSTGGQLLIVNGTVASVLVDNTRFVNSIKGLSIYGNSMVYINLFMEASNVTFINVTFQSNNATRDGNILSVLLNENSSAIHLHSCMFLNNTASTVVLFKTRNLEITSSIYAFNSVKSSLILSQCQTAIVAILQGLMFSDNIGGCLLSLTCHTISTSLIKSTITRNILSSGQGLVALLDYHVVNASLYDINFVFNHGRVFFDNGKGAHATSDSGSERVQFHANIVFFNVLFQSNMAINGDILLLLTNGDDSFIQIQDSKFYGNSATNIAVFGSKRLTIANSTFEDNIAQLNLILSRVNSSLVANFKRITILGNEGGPLLSLLSYNISVNIDDLNISNNELVSGDGLVVFQDYNELYAQLTDIYFINNFIGTPNGGSAVTFTSIIVNTTTAVATHKMEINHVEVLGQQGGGHGAGVFIHHQLCDFCILEESYTIMQCTFANISNANSILYSGSNYSQYSSNLLIQNCTFENNFGTAVHLVNSNLVLENGLILFENNTAEHGAALYLELNSRITFGFNSKVLFIRNEARRYGGAIFCDVSTYGNCYRNVSETLLVLNNDDEMIEFIENAASAGGDSVYFSVPESCDEHFQSISNISQHPFHEQMITSPKELKLDPPASLISYTNVTELRDFNTAYLISNIMLGQEITVPSCLLDYNGNPADVSPFLVSHIERTQKRYFLIGSRGLSIGCESLQGLSNLQIIGNLSSNHSIGSHYFEVIHDSELLTVSLNNDFVIIQLHSFFDITYTLKPIVVNLIIEISATCHAGFHNDQENTRCVCYTADSVVSCAGSNATIRRGYWFGTVDGQPTVTLCPINYCNYDRCESTTTFCPLSPSPNDQCGEYRSGIACGNCKAGFTLSFDSVECVDINKCTAGYTTLIVTITCLFWILTIVIVFAVMYFEVGIGYFFSITFYYSVLDILLGQALRISDALYQLVTIVSSLARLTPQFLGQLCFVTELSGIDQQFIHYIHPLAILFILLLISISARFSPRLSLFVSRGVIHVICFLLLLSYTSIASTSLLLMRPLTFTGVEKTYTYLSPGIKYFYGRHLAYGLVAVASGLLIVIGLPLLLLLEPFLNRKVDFVRIKPLLDQFQGYYKDKYRYFASYYMIGRLVILIVANLNVNNVFTVAYLQIGTLVIMTLVHIIVRPYASRVLNAIDGFLLLTTIMAAILQPFEASNGFSNKTVVGLSFLFVLFPLFTFIVVIVPLMNKQQIKKFVMIFRVPCVKSTKREEREIELQPPSDAYQITVDQNLRETVSTTIASVSDQMSHDRSASDQKPQPIKFQESLLELGID